MPLDDPGAKWRIEGPRSQTKTRKAPVRTFRRVYQIRRRSSDLSRRFLISARKGNIFGGAAPVGLRRAEYSSRGRKTRFACSFRCFQKN